MPTPVTFSPPGTAYVPSAADALRYGVWLMMKADDVIRKDLSYDATNPAKGVRIFSGREIQTIEDGAAGRKLVLPQLLVTSVFASNRFTYGTAKSGERKVVVALTYLEAPDSSYYGMDVDTFRATAEAKMARFELVLQHGTITKPGMVTNKAMIVDPYLSPLREDGTYDPDGIVYLNKLAPEPITYESRFVEQNGEPVAVAYSLIAPYSVNVSNRESTTARGNQ